MYTTTAEASSQAPAPIPAVPYSAGVLPARNKYIPAAKPNSPPRNSAHIVTARTLFSHDIFAGMHVTDLICLRDLSLRRQGFPGLNMSPRFFTNNSHWTLNSCEQELFVSCIADVRTFTRLKRCEFHNFKELSWGFGRKLNCKFNPLPSASCSHARILCTGFPLGKNIVPRAVCPQDE